MNAVREFHRMEIDAYGYIQELHVAQEFGLVDWQGSFHRLCLYKNSTFHEYIEPQRLFAGKALVFDFDGFLAFAVHAPKAEFCNKTPFVNRLDQSRTFVAMYLNR